MKKITKIIATTMAAVALMASSAMAFSLGGYQGPVKFKYQNWEEKVGGGVIDGVGQTLHGIGVVTDIYADNTANTLLWSAATSNEELTIEFDRYISTLYAPSIDVFGKTQVAVGFTGGLLKVYLDSNKNFNAANRTGFNDGTLFLDTLGVAAPNSNFTLTSTLDSTGGFFGGSGGGFLNIIGGSFMDSMAANVFGPNMDLFFHSTLTAPDPSGTTWAVGSDDPVRGNVVPEPGTIALFGAGLVGLILYKRKRG